MQVKTPVIEIDSPYGGERIVADKDLAVNKPRRVFIDLYAGLPEGRRNRILSLRG